MAQKQSKLQLYLFKATLAAYVSTYSTFYLEYKLSYEEIKTI